MHIINKILTLKARNKIELIFLWQAGSAFQSVGADALKGLSPKDFFIFPAGCNISAVNSVRAFLH